MNTCKYTILTNYVTYKYTSNYTYVYLQLYEYLSINNKTVA